MSDYELYHHGILGMHWGIRRYQNKDGSLTAAGKKRYSANSKNVDPIISDRMKSTSTALEYPEKYKDPVDRIIALSQDCLPCGAGTTSSFRDLIKDVKDLDKRANEAGILGIKTLDKYYPEFGRDTSRPIDKDDIEWFLYEDQTIGGGLVADLINRGYSAKQVGKLIDTVLENQKTWEDKVQFDEKGNYAKITDKKKLFADMVVSDISWGEYDGYLKRFAENCEKVKWQQDG